VSRTPVVTDMGSVDETAMPILARKNCGADLVREGVRHVMGRVLSRMSSTGS